VSKKVTPHSNASRTSVMAFCSRVGAVAEAQGPMQPKPMAETSRPLLANLRLFILVSSVRARARCVGFEDAPRGHSAVRRPVIYGPV